MCINNIILVMEYDGYFHVWYSNCFNSFPKKPNPDGISYRWYKDRKAAMLYAYDILTYIGMEWNINVKNGVMEI